MSYYTIKHSVIGNKEELVTLCLDMVSMADKELPDGWTEIRMDKSGNCYAYDIAPTCGGSTWGNGEGIMEYVGVGRLDWNWETFGIIRTPEAKPKRGKKAEQIKLLSAYAAGLLSKLSATEAMLAELQREILGLSKDAPIPTTFDIETIRQSWISEGWDDGAAAMYKAAENTEAAIIYAVNNGTMDIDGAISAARVVGALGNELARGMLTGEGE